ncbi:MAG: hypothetical protein ACRC5H_10600, partial [Treponemataceae bacterium]
SSKPWFLENNPGNNSAIEGEYFYDFPVFYRPTDIPTMSNFTFKGYFTGRYGTGTQYYDGTMKPLNRWLIKKPSAELYGHWEFSGEKVTTGSFTFTDGIYGVVNTTDIVSPVSISGDVVFYFERKYQLKDVSRENDIIYTADKNNFIVTYPVLTIYGGVDIKENARLRSEGVSIRDINLDFPGLYEDNDRLSLNPSPDKKILISVANGQSPIITFPKSRRKPGMTGFTLQGVFDKRYGFGNKLYNVSMSYLPSEAWNTYEMDALEEVSFWYGYWRYTGGNTITASSFTSSKSFKNDLYVIKSNIKTTASDRVTIGDKTSFYFEPTYTENAGSVTKTIPTLEVSNLRSVSNNMALGNEIVGYGAALEFFRADAPDGVIESGFSSKLENVNTLYSISEGSSAASRTNFKPILDYFKFEGYHTQANKGGDLAYDTAMNIKNEGKFQAQFKNIIYYRYGSWAIDKTSNINLITSDRDWTRRTLYNGGRYLVEGNVQLSDWVWPLDPNSYRGTDLYVPGVNSKNLAGLIVNGTVYIYFEPKKEGGSITEASLIVRGAHGIVEGLFSFFARRRGDIGTDETMYTPEVGVPYRNKNDEKWKNGKEDNKHKYETMLTIADYVIGDYIQVTPQKGGRGGAAGIDLKKGNTLILVGNGKLHATGGNGAAANQGQNGMKAQEGPKAARGGSGGAGAGGGGAGIGTHGIMGGAGGWGHFSNDDGGGWGEYAQQGRNAYTATDAAGTLKIYGAVDVVGKGGDGGLTSPTLSIGGHYWRKVSLDRDGAGAGGNGAPGAKGAPIGLGGGGGGGGGGGARGRSVEKDTKEKSGQNSIPPVGFTGGHGGKNGAGNMSGASGGAGTPKHSFDPGLIEVYSKTLFNDEFSNYAEQQPHGLKARLVYKQ